MANENLEDALLHFAHLKTKDPNLTILGFATQFFAMYGYAGSFLFYNALNYAMPAYKAPSAPVDRNDRGDHWGRRRLMKKYGKKDSNG